MSPELQSRIKSELKPGERIIWVGHPLPNLFAAPYLKFWLLGIPFTCFAIFAALSLSGLIREIKNPGGHSPWAVTPFIIVGALINSVYFWERRRARWMAYVLTDSRALVLQPRFAELHPAWTNAVLTREITAADFAHLQKRDRDNGAGDLYLGIPYDVPKHATVLNGGFIAIPAVAEVEEMVKDVRAKLKPPTSAGT